MCGCECGGECVGVRACACRHTYLHTFVCLCNYLYALTGLLLSTQTLMCPQFFKHLLFIASLPLSAEASGLQNLGHRPTNSSHEVRMENQCHMNTMTHYSTWRNYLIMTDNGTTAQASATALTTRTCRQSI